MQRSFYNRFILDASLLASVFPVFTQVFRETWRRRREVAVLLFFVWTKLFPSLSRFPPKEEQEKWKQYAH